jgi:hypothetical protein
MIKEKTETVELGTVLETQNMANIRGQTKTKTERILKKRLRLLEQSLNGKMWKILEAPDHDKDRED